MHRALAFATLGLALVCGCSSGSARTPSKPSPSVASSAPTPRRAPTGARLDYLKMLTAKVGWGFEYGAATIVRTDDGGRSWQSFSPISGGSVRQVYAHRENLAWALAVDAAGVQRVARTSDAGATWQTSGPVPVDGSVAQMDFADADHGWLLVLKAVHGNQRTAVPSFLTTSDGGANWRPAGSASAGCSVYSIAFLNATTGWLVGGFCGEKPYLLVSHDGGESWSAQSFPAPVKSASRSALPMSLIDAPAFWTFREGAFVYREGVTTGANALQYSTLYRTHDGGATWSAIGLPATPLTYDFRHGPALWFVGSGPSGDTEHLSFYGSTDGGDHWKKVADSIPRFGVVQFPDASVGIASVAGPPPQLLMESTDGGQTWHDIGARLP